MKDSFVFYRSFKDSLSELSDNDKLIMYEAISDYALDKSEPNLKGFPKALFKLIRPQLDANWKRYEAGVTHGHKGAKYGKLGGRPKSKKTLSKPSNNPLQTESKPSNVNGNVNVYISSDSIESCVYSFDKFWSDYDKKIGSKSKLGKKWNKISDSDKLKIKEYIPRYKAAQPEKQYRKNPETFLNNEGWNDEIITKGGINDEPERKQYKQY